MAASTIPVDLFNPGQVFACLGFMELADVLLGDAEGRFDWSDPAQTCFHLVAAGTDEPVQAVLEFLKAASSRPVSPLGVEGPWPLNATSSETYPAPLSELLKSDKKGYSASNLPFILGRDAIKVCVSSWLEGDGREALKLFAGQQVAFRLMTNVLEGDPSKPGTQGVRDLCTAEADPFQVGPVGGRFGYDSRGAWDAINVGSSLDEQGAVLLVSPVVESLAVIGLEFARPLFLSTYEIRYAVWQAALPLSLARVALAQPDRFGARASYRFFRSNLGEDKQYKKCFPAREE
jgi:CRISPR-associated protein Csx14